MVVGSMRSMEEPAAARLRLVIRRAEEAQVSTSAELVAGLREMVNNPAFSDMTFLCNDGESVRASRLMLAGRSEVLRSMLQNGMAESSRTEINLAKVSSPAMLSVLEFLYTGTIFSHSPGSWKEGWEVIIASQFFLLPLLEIIVRKFMHQKIYDAAPDLPVAAMMLTEAVRVEGLCDQADDLFRELVILLSSNWSYSGFVQNLSEDAFEYLLANSRYDIENEDMFSFREYLRFRQVIQWWLYQNNLGPHRIEELMSCLAPDKERVWSILRHPENADRGHLQHVLCDWNALQSNQAPKTAATRMLSNIDYRLIHPIILAKVVEPLEISCRDVFSAFRFHALRSPIALLAFKTPRYIWKHNECYGTIEHGHVIYRTGTTSGLAVLDHVIHTTRATIGSALSQNMMVKERVSEWEFILGEECSLFAELGLVLCGGGFSLQKKLSDCSACVLKSNGKETLVNKWLHGGQIWNVLLAQPLCEGSRVSFIFDKRTYTCSLSINGQDFGTVWTGLYLSYVPAVSFGNCEPGHMSIKLVRGF